MSLESLRSQFEVKLSHELFGTDQPTKKVQLKKQLFELLHIVDVAMT